MKMKKVYSISIGSSTRDHSVKCRFLGEDFQISRYGTNGSVPQAVKLLQMYDGSVDAFGAGGVGFYVELDGKRYYFRDAIKMRDAVKISKIGDGSKVKGLLERRAFDALERYLQEFESRSLRGMSGLQTTGSERWSMAQTMVDMGIDTVFGDMMFALGINFPVRSLAGVKMLAATLMPVVGQMPFSWIYPVGADQEKESIQKWGKYYQRANIIAGDFLQIKQYLPYDMTGKIIVTNTTTAADVELLKRRGVHILVTTTPRLNGRSFGTNVIEAVLLSIINKQADEITPSEYLELLDTIPIKPEIMVLDRDRIR